MRSVHGVCRRALAVDRDGERPGWRSARLPVDGADRQARSGDHAEAHLDRADAGRLGARTGDGNQGKGGTASDTVTIQVIQREQKVFTFEDVHFDFDRYTLRPEAVRVLQQAVTAMKENATLRLTLEGHTCNIGTAEYNLALGERRATAVREYLTSNGVSADRLQTVSYGEERPKHDNSREETRRLNRRAALTVRLTQ